MGGKQEGRLLVSEDYVCFVKKKQLEGSWKREEGGVSEDGERESGEMSEGVWAGDEVMLLKDVVEFSIKDKKLLIRGKAGKVCCL